MKKEYLDHLKHKLEEFEADRIPITVKKKA